MSCDHCGSASLSKISVELGDGTEVTLQTCHFCEFRVWTKGEAEVPLRKVLELASTHRPR